MKKDTLLILGLAGIGAYLFLQNQRQYQNPPQNWAPQYQQAIPAPPPPSTPEWQNWARFVLETYGNVIQLWQPGGPFYKGPSQEELMRIVGAGAAGSI